MTARAVEKWAEVVEAHELVEADTGALRTIAELAERRDDVDSALLDAIRTARKADSFNRRVRVDRKLNGNEIDQRRREKNVASRAARSVGELTPERR